MKFATGAKLGNYSFSGVVVFPNKCFSPKQLLERQITTKCNLSQERQFYKSRKSGLEQILKRREEGGIARQCLVDCGPALGHLVLEFQIVSLCYLRYLRLKGLNKTMCFKQQHFFNHHFLQQQNFTTKSLFGPKDLENSTLEFDT